MSIIMQRKKFVEIKNVTQLKEALKTDKWALSKAIMELRDCKEAALASVRVNGYSLCGASKRLRNDLTIVREAVRQNPNALEYASDRLKDHDDLFLEAMRGDFFDPEACEVSNRLQRRYERMKG